MRFDRSGDPYGWSGAKTPDAAAGLGALCEWIRPKDSRDRALVTAIESHVQAAKEAAVGKQLDPPRRLGSSSMGRLSSGRGATSTPQRLNSSTSRRPTTYLVKCHPCSGTCSVISLRPTRGDKSSSCIARSVGMNDPNHPSRQNGGDQDLDSEKAIERERGDDRHNGASGKLGGAARA